VVWRGGAAMDIATVRDLLIIILFALLIIVIIGGSIAAFIIYRRVNKTVKNTVNTVERPIRFAEKIFAYTRGGTKGFGEAVNIILGRRVDHEHQTNQR
jgi:hypothetical protein